MIPIESSEKKRVPAPPPRRPGHRRSVECIKTFMAVLRMLKYGTTVYEISRNLHLGRRQVHRWLNVVDDVFGIERIPGEFGHRNWMYRINREKLREKF